MCATAHVDACLRLRTASCVKQHTDACIVHNNVGMCLNDAEHDLAYQKSICGASSSNWLPRNYIFYTQSMKISFSMKCSQLYTCLGRDVISVSFRGRQNPNLAGLV